MKYENNNKKNRPERGRKRLEIVLAQ